MDAEENTNLQPSETPPVQAEANSAAFSITTPKTSGLAKLSFACGLLSILFPIFTILIEAFIMPISEPSMLIIWAMRLLFDMALALAFAGIVLGIIVLVRIKKRQNILRGRGLAISGLIMGRLLLLLIAVGIIYGILLCTV